MYAIGSELASAGSIRAHHHSGYGNGQSCNHSLYHFQDDVSAGYLVLEAIWYGCNQEEAALYAEGKGTEAGQVLQATYKSEGCHTVQSTSVAADSADSGLMTTGLKQLNR